MALRLSDIEIKEKSGKVLVRRGKVFKERLVPLNLNAREGLKPWLEVRNEVLKNMAARFLNKGKDVPARVYSDFLFIGQRGVLTTRGVHYITQKIGQLANL